MDPRTTGPQRGSELPGCSRTTLKHFPRATGFRRAARPTRMHVSMNRLRHLALAACLSTGAVACAPAPTASVEAGNILITDAWMRATPPGAPVAGGYLMLHNTGETRERLLSVRSSAAREVQIHEVRHEGGIARMRPVRDGLAIAPDSTVTLQPGGLHLMFLDPVRPLAEGDTVNATLQFEHAGPINIPLAVRAPGAASAVDHPAH